VDPAGEPDRLAGVGGAERAAGVGAVGVHLSEFGVFFEGAEGRTEGGESQGAGGPGANTKSIMKTRSPRP
jgi:hypothetical protein